MEPQTQTATVTTHPSAGMAAEYIDAAETAKLIRKRVKTEWPEVKFSVRTRRYSGGSSVNVSWTDGPMRQDVEAVLHGFEGRGFDGMCDGTYFRRSWLTPAGHAILAGGATDGYGAQVEDPAPPVAGSRLVRFTSFVFCNRHISLYDERFAHATRWLNQHFVGSRIERDRLARSLVELLAAASWEGRDGFNYDQAFRFATSPEFRP